MNLRALLLAGVPALLLLSNFASAEAHRFEKNIVAFETADRESPPPKHAILFVGDSTFTKWAAIHEDLPEYTVINRGFGGSGISDLLYFTDRIVMPYEPRMIVVQEGGNDLHAGRTPDEVMADMKGFVAKVRAKMPEVPIVIGSLTPNPARFSEIETRKVVNRLLQDFAASERKVTYVNFFDAWLTAAGQPRPELFIEDQLHPNPAGYHLRVEILKPVLGPPDKVVK